MALNWTTAPKPEMKAYGTRAGALLQVSSCTEAVSPAGGRGGQGGFRAAARAPGPVIKRRSA